MNIVVMGAGAMGSLYGALMKEAGHDVVLVDVWQQHIDAINAAGLKLEVGEITKIIKIPAKRSREVTTPAELVILFTKNIHSEKALEEARGFIDSNTCVLTVQNGLGNIEKIQKYVPLDKIIVGVTNYPSDLVGPGHVRSKGTGKTQILSADGKIRPQLETIRQAIDEAGLHCVISQDVFAAIWEKVAFNAAMNSLCTVTGLTVGLMGATPQSHDLAIQIAKETIAVANKKGVPASEDAVLNMMEDAFKNHFNHMPSMLQDFLAKRTTEVEFINGAIAREAAQLGMATPVTAVLYQLVRALEQNYDKQIISH
jgi:2-dehydropantoate 2-reductase